jgi:hypothetical protein
MLVIKKSPHGGAWILLHRDEKSRVGFWLSPSGRIQAEFFGFLGFCVDL